MAKSKPKSEPEIRSAFTDYTGEYTGSFALPTLAGTTVTTETSLTISAVWQAINIYANTISGLNLYVAEKDRRGGHSPAYDHPIYDLVHCRPNRISTSFRYRQVVVNHVLTFGNSYSEIEFDKEGNAIELHLRDPRNVNPWLDDQGNVWYHFTREHISLPASKILHFAGLGFDGLKGYSPIHMSRDVLGLAIAQNNYQSSLIGNNATPTGYLEYPNALKSDQQGRLRDEWNKVHQGSERAGNVGILTGGVKFVPMSFSPLDQELIAQCNWSISQVARIFNLPPHMLGQMDSATFGNIEEQNIQFVQQSLTPWLVNFEQEMNRKLLKLEDQKDFTVRHDLRSLLRGNLAAQTAYNTAMFAMGALSINEIRLSEGDNPIEDEAGDKHWIPTNNLTAIEDMSKPHEAEAEPTSQDETEVTTDDINVAATALNGAQISSLLEIITQVSLGALPLDSAKGLIAASFPTLTTSQVADILDSLDGFKPPQSDPSNEAISAVRALVLDPVGRLTRREVLAARKAGSKADFREWVESYYNNHATMLEESLAPSLKALATLEGRELDPRALATTLVEASRTALEGLAVCVPMPELPDAIERETQQWEQSRALAVSSWLEAR